MASRIAQVRIDGNEAFTDEEVVGAIASKPEGFWWFRSGNYDDDRVDQDIRQRLPDWYGDRGYVDFQVTSDSLIPDPVNGKAILRLEVDEGEKYVIGKIEIVGNRRYSTEDLAMAIPFALPGQINAGADIGTTFDRGDWAGARAAIEAAGGKVEE